MIAHNVRHNGISNNNYKRKRRMSMKPSGWKMGRNKKGERNAGITDIIRSIQSLRNGDYYG